MTLYPSGSVANVKDRVRLLAAPRMQRLTLAFLVGVACLAALFGSGVWLQRDVTVAADGALIRMRTSAPTVGEVLAVAGLNLGPWDEVVPAVKVKTSDGLAVQVRRAVPVVLHLDGRELRLMSAAATVADLLAGSRLPVGPDDKVVPGRDRPVTPGLDVTVTRIVRSYQHRDDPIPFDTVRREDMSLGLGQTKVVQEGANGRMARLLLVTYEDGRAVGAEELRKSILAEPKERVVRVGTAGDIVRDGKTIHFLKALPVTATAYEPGPVSCGPTADGYTALGLKATRGIIAVDPRVIPFWTKVYVDGYGYAVAGDTGSAIKGNRIDVCYDTLDEALRWGVKRVKVYILELPKS